MITTALSLTAPPAAESDPKVTPELLAACLARYSRSNLGIKAILDLIDWSNPDKSVEGIFKLVDYGHASIGGLTGGIPIAMDGISMLLAYKLFEFAQQADGQESSTRYIKMSPERLPDPTAVGIPEDLAPEWTEVMTFALTVYHGLYEQLDDLAKKDPSVVRLPVGATDKVADRLRKNYALDRARYVLPAALKNNMALVMSARAWTDVIKQTEALGLPEAVALAGELRRELAKYAPRLIRHSNADEASRAQAEQLLHYSAKCISETGVPVTGIPDEVFLSIEQAEPTFLPSHQTLEESFQGKKNRYSTTGASTKRPMTRFAWNNIAIAELRDLNRHRTGFRYTPLVPVGFYLPDGVSHPELPKLLGRYQRLVERLAQRAPGVHLYGFLLGTQVGFEHSTNLDKLIYEIELRTGLGAHFRYAEHLTAIADLLIKKVPSLANHIDIGTAEPE